ncbi:hypothetical protein BST61_g10750 [Cercospora zeina]
MILTRNVDAITCEKKLQEIIEQMLVTGTFFTDFTIETKNKTFEVHRSMIAKATTHRMVPQHLGAGVWVLETSTDIAEDMIRHSHGLQVSRLPPVPDSELTGNGIIHVLELFIEAGNMAERNASPAADMCFDEAASLDYAVLPAKHAKSVLRSIWRHESNWLPDLKVMCGDGLFLEVHKMVVCAGSPYIAKLCEESPKGLTELKLPEPWRILASICQCLYGHEDWHAFGEIRVPVIVEIIDNLLAIEKYGILTARRHIVAEAIYCTNTLNLDELFSLGAELSTTAPKRAAQDLGKIIEDEEAWYELHKSSDFLKVVLKKHGLGSLQRLWESQRWTDLNIISSEGEIIKVHKSIVCEGAPRYIEILQNRKCSSSSEHELKKDEVKVNQRKVVIYEVIHYLYGIEFRHTFHEPYEAFRDIVDFFEAARELQLPGLSAQIETAVCNWLEGCDLVTGFDFAAQLFYHGRDPDALFVGSNTNVPRTIINFAMKLAATSLDFIQGEHTELEYSRFCPEFIEALKSFVVRESNNAAGE